MRKNIGPDYVSERFYRSLIYGAVPVTLGGADHTAYAPTNSYIDMADFASPRDLADYLHLLDTNDGLYARYFEWRKEYEVKMHPKTGWCNLCEMLNDPNLPTKSYANMSRWWFDEPCYNEYVRENHNLTTFADNTV